MGGFQPLYGDYMVIIWWFIGVLMDEPNWMVFVRGNSQKNGWMIWEDPPFLETPEETSWPGCATPTLTLQSRWLQPAEAWIDGGCWLSLWQSLLRVQSVGLFVGLLGRCIPSVRLDRDAGCIKKEASLWKKQPYRRRDRQKPKQKKNLWKTKERGGWN